MAAVRRRAGVDLHRRRPDLGCLVAPHCWPRHVLDAGSCSRAGSGGDRGTELRLARSEDHLRRIPSRESAVRSLLAVLLRPARRLGVHLGHADDDHVRPVRRLVAQRLRTRCQNHQSAPHGPRLGHDRNPDRRDADGAERAEPRVGRGSEAVQHDPRILRRNSDHDDRDCDPGGCQRRKPHARGQVLPDHGVDDTALPDRTCSRVASRLGRPRRSPRSTRRSR